MVGADRTDHRKVPFIVAWTLAPDEAFQCTGIQVFSALFSSQVIQIFQPFQCTFSAFSVHRYSDILCLFRYFLPFQVTGIQVFQPFQFTGIQGFSAFFSAQVLRYFQPFQCIGIQVFSAFSVHRYSGSFSLFSSQVFRYFQPFQFTGIQVYLSFLACFSSIFLDL